MRAQRLGLLVMTLSSAVVAGWAVAAPRSFYDSFPGFGHHWVSMAGAYDEHLVRDVGSLNLAVTIVVGWATWTLDRRLVTAATVGFLGNAVPHLTYHLGHLDHFSRADAIAQTVVLVLAVLIPLGVLAGALRAPTACGQSN